MRSCFSSISHDAINVYNNPIEFIIASSHKNFSFYLFLSILKSFLLKLICLIIEIKRLIAGVKNLHMRRSNNFNPKLISLLFVQIDKILPYPQAPIIAKDPIPTHPHLANIPAIIHGIILPKLHTKIDLTFQAHSNILTFPHFIPPAHSCWDDHFVGTINTNTITFLF